MHLINTEKLNASTTFAFKSTILSTGKVKRLPKDLKKPKNLTVGASYQESEEESEEEEDSEEAEMGKRTSLMDDYDPYDVFGTMS